MITQTEETMIHCRWRLADVPMWHWRYWTWENEITDFEEQKASHLVVNFHFGNGLNPNSYYEFHRGIQIRIGPSKGSHHVNCLCHSLFGHFKSTLYVWFETKCIENRYKIYFLNAQFNFYYLVWDDAQKSEAETECKYFFGSESLKQRLVRDFRTN